jgi:outer membrane protein
MQLLLKAMSASRSIVLVMLSLSPQFANSHQTVPQLPPHDLVSERRPLWQFGFGAGGGVTPHYPAANQSSLRFIAIPTFRYRGQILRSDDEGTRARLVRFEDTEIDLSGGASFPVNSYENEARSNMPKLDWIGEAGPRLGFRWRIRREDCAPEGPCGRGDLVRLLLPIRTVFSSDFSSVTHRGFIFQPELSFERIFRKSEMLNSEIAIEFDTSISLISQHLAEYFFSVPPEFASSNRASYDARAGLLSVSAGLILKISQRRGNNVGSTFFAGVRHNHHGPSVNRESPLHKADQTVTVFTGVNVYWLNSERSSNDE